METKLIQNNFFKGRNGNRISHIVVHINGANTTNWSAYPWFNNPNQKYANGQSVKVSTHYGVLTNGTKEKYVNEEDTAFHAGTEGWNFITIGIEFNDNLTDDTYKAGAELIADICKRNNIECSRTFVVTHREVLVSAFGPSVTLTCPDNLDVDRLVREARILLMPPVVQNNDELQKAKEALENQRKEYEAKILKSIEENQKSIQEIREEKLALEKLLEIKDQNIIDLKKEAQNALQLDLGGNTELLSNIVDETINTDGLLVKWSKWVDENIKSPTFRSILKYDIFVYLGSILGSAGLVVLFPNLPPTIITLGGIVQGIIYKLLLTRYDTNKDGKLDKSDFKTLK